MNEISSSKTCSNSDKITSAIDSRLSLTSPLTISPDIPSVQFMIPSNRFGRYVTL